MGGAGASRRACRIKVKGAGIAGFFLVASLYSWWVPGADVAQRRVLLETEGAVAGARDDTSRGCEGVAMEPALVRCEMARKRCTGESGRSVVNYVVLHYCGMGGAKWVSVPVLVGVLLLAFYVLAETAEGYFSPVVRRLVEALGLTPSMGGVTLLALGNGAPDIFASLAAIAGDNSRIGLGAILSAGTFVSAFVVGSVALAAAPFAVQPMPFIRDVSFYLGAVCLLFLVYLNANVTLWQALAMISFYVVFVVVVLCTDKKHDADSAPPDPDLHIELKDSPKVSAEEVTLDVSSFKSGTEPESSLGKLSRALAELISVEEVMTALSLPVSVVLKSTIPEIEPAKWSRSYGTANVVLCPLLMLYMFTSLVSLNRHIVVLAPSLRLPIWVLMLLQGAFMGAAYYLAVKRPPAHGHFLAVVVAFIMSVFWISLIAGELLGCLVTLGIILGVSPALLGLTVLAWGNSIGDLVADVAVARVGQPSMAVAGCFAGPMFNMLVGLGSALSLRTFKDFPVSYQLDHHPGILVAFGFLTLNLLGTLSVVSSSKFQLTRTWGKCLIGWYVLFMVVSVVVAQMASVENFT